MEKLRIACLGGRHTHYQRFSEMIRDEAHCELVGVWDRDPEKAAAWAGRIGSTPLDSWESVLEDPSIDGVLITDTPFRHEELAIAAAEAGKHIYMEQPLAVSVAAAERIRAAVKKAGVHVTVANPVKKRVPALGKKLMDEGLLGEIRNVRMRTLHDNSTLFMEGKFPDFGYVFDKSESGGGAMNNMGCHGVKVLRWFLGMPVSCFGMYTSLTPIGAENDIDENAVTVYQFPNGAIGTIETGWVHPRYQCSFELNGTEGCVMAWGDGAKYRTKNSDWIFVPAEELPVMEEHPIPCWVHNILENRVDDEYSIDEAYDLTVMISAAYASQGKEIRIGGAQ